ncbi:MAG TPA: hypothetical protein VFL03_04050 [Candidatus Limnocylindrales bacterium]|jgi:hypothetical protein|nr:hypothetical protein [Candidatus Limnocylindrales bacterium]
MTPDSPLHRALSAWRVAERRLSLVSPDDPARPSLVAEVERRRLAYQAQFGAVEDVAGHGAPYVDDVADESAGEGAPADQPSKPVVTAGG